MYADTLTNRIFVGEYVLDYGLPEKANRNITIYVVMREDRPRLNFPSANIKVLGSHAAVRSIPILRSIDDLDPLVRKVALPQ